MTTYHVSEEPEAEKLFEEYKIDIEEKVIDIGAPIKQESNELENFEEIIIPIKKELPDVLDPLYEPGEVFVNYNIDVKEEILDGEQCNIQNLTIRELNDTAQNSNAELLTNDISNLQTVKESSHISTTNKSTVKERIPSRRKINNFSCRICAKKFSLEKKLMEHMAISHSVLNKNQISNQAKYVLQSWFNEHVEHPHPTQAEKLDLSTKANITLRRVNHWFINARHRYDQEQLRKKENEKITIQVKNINLDIASSAENSNQATSAENFVEATSNNLPKIDTWMLAEFMSENNCFSAAKIRRVKELSPDFDVYMYTAIGYVKLYRENDICIVQCKICPEPNEEQHQYSVTLKINEEITKVISVTCQDCIAIRGGCKHAITFLLWVNRKSEERTPISVESYWREPKLVNVSEKNFVTTMDFGAKKLKPPTNGNTFLNDVVQHLMQNEKYSDVPLLQCFKEKTGVQLLDLHSISIHFVIDKATNFFEYCSKIMSSELCHEATELTQHQFKSEFWYKLRFARITGSKIYDVVIHCQKDDELIKQLILGTHKYKEAHVANKERALKDNAIKIVENQFKIKFKQTGLILSKDHPVLVATPDGISNECVVEIKCLAADKPVSLYVNQKNVITSKYNAQIQLQMYLTGKKKGMLCVADQDFVNNGRVKIIVVVDFDELFITDLIKKSETYWLQNILPLLLN